MLLADQKLLPRSLSGKSPEGIVTKAVYRKICKDITSSDDKVLDRINYLEEFCRIIIQKELNNHD